jgi:hypothetical protein
MRFASDMTAEVSDAFAKIGPVTCAGMRPALMFASAVGLIATRDSLLGARH